MRTIARTPLTFLLASLSFLDLIDVASAAANPIGPNPNPKRGLVYVPDKENPKPQDDKVWVQAGSPLTWYYNYETKPTRSLEGGATPLEFVPMLWGDYDNTLIKDVDELLAKGYKIEYVLGFNEPDNPANSGTGGSGVPPESAAARWKQSIEPLAKKGIKLGAPGVTGAPSGLEWLKAFMAACKNCTFDFIPLHWYGNFDGLASHLGTYSAAFPNQTFWFTEVAFNHQPVEPSQEFFNLTMEYFDRMESVGRYTWFGSFRSDVSNVGPNAALLDKNGGLTYIGAWYLNKNSRDAASVTGSDASRARVAGVSLSIVTVAAVIANWLV
ncbi:hypothetical protein Dda_7798 [Drechslerella dactyloides]|uniref:Asl1-like glycosyl hydrolase catalytic domain-containing protein n=1 Tax=Drechslerella dactyloides TaxID=74499 RepID=A0AAD6NFY5_DREDA|nr:hypothetical protein Dda_7798 [Drechslerella dactyloides]